MNKCTPSFPPQIHSPHAVQKVLEHRGARADVFTGFACPAPQLVTPGDPGPVALGRGDTQCLPVKWKKRTGGLLSAGAVPSRLPRLSPLALCLVPRARWARGQPSAACRGDSVNVPGPTPLRRAPGLGDRWGTRSHGPPGPGAEPCRPSPAGPHLPPGQQACACPSPWESTGAPGFGVAHLSSPARADGVRGCAFTAKPGTRLPRKSSDPCVCGAGTPNVSAGPRSASSSGGCSCSSDSWLSSSGPAAPGSQHGTRVTSCIPSDTWLNTNRDVQFPRGGSDLFLRTCRGN